MKVQFADCALDVGARRILRKDREVHLSPKAFELLVVLVERRGDAVSKTELLERVWPKVYVSDASLARVVTELRDAIGGREARDDPDGARPVHTHLSHSPGPGLNGDRDGLALIAA
ncbi:MAG: hypothetical protein AUH43_25690 [Acidobacteria bacterium 13_1_40CM_65_14]|nr:MAG: hypothetical protein AUH43_25690 [Acidobacteria bacterium 13_1_40CM_65_14]